MKFLQKLGKSLMLPVCVLPICGILMGIGYALCPASIQGGEIIGIPNIIGYLLVKTGGAIIDNMSLLFVIGCAMGMSKDGKGVAVLSGLVSWLVITSLLSTNVMSVFYGDLGSRSSAYLAFSKIQNPTIAMLAGLIGANCYNKFKSTKLPDFLAFFSGERSVAIVTVLVSFVFSIVLAFIWPFCFGLMVQFGNWIISLGGLGCGLYAFFNRLLIPTGVHHALNNVFWFDTIGLGDLTKFWAGKISEDVGWSLGMYMSGFFPCMMGGIPGAALAMYRCAKDKKKAMGVLFSTAVCSFLCGLTEPFEFSFMFMCFPLYVVYSILYGIFSVITYYVNFRGGFSFSAGLVDLIFSQTLPAANNTLMIIPLCILAFVVFYVVFSFVIKKFNLPTIGREEDINKENVGALGNITDTNFQVEGLLKAVGGRENVVSCDCCATRLRLVLKNSSLVNSELGKQYGAIDIVIPSETDCQIIIGPKVQQVLEEFKTILEPFNNLDTNTSFVTKGQIINLSLMNFESQLGHNLQHKGSSNLKSQDGCNLDVKEESDFSFSSPCEGNIVPMENIPDQTFSKGSLGPTIGIYPSSGLICAPINGILLHLQETKHAFIIGDEKGNNLLVHIGLDTVKLKGQGFETLVKEGDKLKCGEPMLKVDLDFIKENSLNPMLVVVYLIE